MLARRTAVPSTKPAAAPDAAGELSALRAASGEEPAIASPVHALQAELAEGLGRRRRRFDPSRAMVAAALVIYTAAFWWGLASVGSIWLRHIADR